LPPNPLELLSRPGFAALLQRAASEYDLVLIDTPAATEYADAQAITFRAGDALLVSRKDQTRQRDRARVRDRPMPARGSSAPCELFCMKRPPSEAVTAAWCCSSAVHSPTRAHLVARSTL
jgi:hypothetical protein